MDASMSHAHAGLHAAYQAHAEDLLRRLDRERGVAGAVRGQVIEQLRGGDIRAGAIARRMAMSHSTLSRRLAEEGTSHREIVESVRRELAYEYLADRTLAISEVAFLLGFSHVTTFYRAFERWSADGTTPAAYRATLRGR
jgi:AraC-like DNA-binding protein